MLLLPNDGGFAVKIFYWPFQGGTFFYGSLLVICVSCLSFNCLFCSRQTCSDLLGKG